MMVLAPEKLEVFSFGPIQSLYEMARAVCLHNPGDFEGLEDAVAKLEAAAEYSDKLEKVRQIAADNYVDSSCDIDIDGCCLAHHNGSDGYWVGAWLYVNGVEAGDSEDDEDSDCAGLDNGCTCESCTTQIVEAVGGELCPDQACPGVIDDCGECSHCGRDYEACLEDEGGEEVATDESRAFGRHGGSFTA